MNRGIAKFVVAIAVAQLLQPTAVAQSNEALAIVGGLSFSEADVRATAADELERLETRRLQFEATSKADEHQVIEEALNGMIADRLLTTEAADRGLSVEDLLATEVTANIPLPSRRGSAERLQPQSRTTVRGPL